MTQPTDERAIITPWDIEQAERHYPPSGWRREAIMDLAKFVAEVRVAVTPPASEQAEPVGLSDPNVVHANILRGSIAAPSPEQIWHLYGLELLDAIESAPGYHRRAPPDRPEAVIDPIPGGVTLSDTLAALAEDGKMVRTGYVDEPVSKPLADAIAKTRQAIEDAVDADRTFPATLKPSPNEQIMREAAQAVLDFTEYAPEAQRPDVWRKRIENLRAALAKVTRSEDLPAGA